MDSYVKRTLAVYEAVHLQELGSPRPETPKTVASNK